MSEPALGRSAAELVDRDLLGDAELERIARALVAAHAAAPADAEVARFGAPEVLAERVRDELGSAHRALLDHLDADEAAELEQAQLRFVRDSAELLEARARAGRVREGHGALALARVYLGEGQGATFTGALVEEPELRCADVCADVASLAADLVARERVDLAERFVALYASESHDFELYRLLDFYEAHRALLLGRICARWAADPDAGVELRERSAREARRQLRAAVATRRRPLLPPALVAMGGLVASGKSTLARRVAGQMGAPVVVADRTRAFVASALEASPLHEVRWAEGLAQGFTDRVYAEVLRRARAVLESGRAVVVDGCFRSRAQREAARRAAQSAGVLFFFVECRAGRETSRARLRERSQQAGLDESVWEAIYEDLRAQWEPVREIPPEAHVLVDGERTTQENAAILRARLPRWPGS